jgi:uncharacterized membrane protein (UPF0127 family)
MNMKASAYVIFGDGTRIAVEVAETEAARARGLMFRPPSPPASALGASARQAAFADDEGMLFVFDIPGRYGFWMKNVRAPLDIIWLDEALRVVCVVENAPPCNADPCTIYEPPVDTSFVIEVAGGFARRHEVAVGDAVSISLPRSSSCRTTTRGRC